jgi:hypothetical protein
MLIIEADRMVINYFHAFTDAKKVIMIIFKCFIETIWRTADMIIIGGHERECWMNFNDR